jgi:hypothetical protein
LKTVLGERQRGEQAEQGKQGERPKNG